MDFIKMRIEQLKKDYASCGFPETVSGFTREELMLPMRDSKRMRTVLYKPAGRTCFPVILRRTCYPQDEELIAIDGENFARRGYCFIYQFCRGTGGSEGDWLPNVNEREDGIDTVNWIHSQPWCDGLGYWGLSYAALTGWAFADAVKGKVASMFLLHYGTDRFTSAYHKGLFHHDVLTGWSMQNAGWPITADYEESCRYMPHLEVDEALWGGKLPWYRDYITNEYLEDSYWQQGWWKQLREIPSQVEIPLYIVSGWYDHHHESTMKTWSRLNPVAKEMSWLEIGGWNHGLLPVLEDKQTDHLDNVEAAKALGWFDLTLKKKQIPSKRIRYYVPGKDCWMEAASWEEQKRNIRTLYLDSNTPGAEGPIAGSLAYEVPARAGSCSYTFDPADPVRTHGGDCTLGSWNATGSLLQPQPGCRKDVLTFLSAPLEEDLVLNGKIDVELWAKTDCTDTAFFASIDEVTPEGRAYHIRTSATTIHQELPRGFAYTPGTPVKVVADMSDICYALPAGSRIRIDITSSDFPQYAVHSNQAGPWASITEHKPARQTILTGAEYPSCVKLPVL